MGRLEFVQPRMLVALSRSKKRQKRNLRMFLEKRTKRTSGECTSRLRCCRGVWGYGTIRSGGGGKKKGVGWA